MPAVRIHASIGTLMSNIRTTATTAGAVSSTSEALVPAAARSATLQSPPRGRPCRRTSPAPSPRATRTVQPTVTGALPVVASACARIPCAADYGLAAVRLSGPTFRLARRWAVRAAPASLNRRSTATDRANSVRLMITTQIPESAAANIPTIGTSVTRRARPQPGQGTARKTDDSNKGKTARQHEGRQPDRQRIEAPAVERVERSAAPGPRTRGCPGGFGKRGVNQRLHRETRRCDHSSRQCDVRRQAPGWMQAREDGPEVPGEEQQGHGPERDDEGGDLVLCFAVVGVPGSRGRAHGGRGSRRRRRTPRLPVRRTAPGAACTTLGIATPVALILRSGCGRPRA